MDIYILREGEETGPFTNETAQTMVAEGTVSAGDFAWRPGLPEWLPLSDILTHQPSGEEVAESEPESEPEPVAVVEPVEEEAVEEKLTPVPTPQAALKVETKAAEKSKGKSETALIEVKPPEPEPATEKQKALLNFLGISIPKDLTKDRASGIVNDAMENSKYTSQVAQWNEMKLQLHPELFSAEIQARRENRANQFFDLCQTTGSEYFTGITKAHCQVLVGFLDVKFPQWDARGTDAGERYFFPAVAEKFPQLVNKQWRGRLQYGEAKSHDSARLKSKSPTSRVKAKSASPIAAVAKGIFLGGLILCVLYGGYVAAQRLPGATLKDKIEGLTHLKVVSMPSSAPAAPANPEQSPAVETAARPTLTAEPAPAPTAALPPGPAPEPAVPAPAPIATTDPIPPPAEMIPAIPPASAPVASMAAPGDPAMIPPPAALPGMPALPDAAAVPPPMAEMTPMAPAGIPIAPGIPTLPDATPMAPIATVPAVPPAPATPPADPAMGIPLSNSIANAPMAALPGMEPPVPVAPPPATPPVAAVVPPTPEPAALPPGLPPPTMPADSATTSAVPTARTSLVLTKPVDVQLAYGKLTLPAGTAVKLISRQGTTLKIGYQNNVITVPVTSTDLE